MLQSQIINVLPRRILAGLWATPETRLSLSHLLPNKSTNDKPAAASSTFLRTELPVRYTHILRLLSTLSQDSLQSPIIRNVSHNYLYDICTLLHPSLSQTSPRAFTNVLQRLRASQAKNLVRLKYALLSTPNAASAALMENISTIGFGIHLLLDQHLSEEHVQKICPEQIATKSVNDALNDFKNVFKKEDMPIIEIKKDILKNNKSPNTAEQDFQYIPSVLYRILYESTVLSLKAEATKMSQAKQLSWFQRQFKQKQQKMSLRIFGGPTSVGFRLDSPTTLLETDLLPSIPRDSIGIPTCGSVLSGTGANTIDQNNYENIEWESLRGWRSAKTLASHWGGNLDVVNVDGLGSTIYLALDRDTSLLERYPSRIALAASANSLLRQHRRSSAVVNAASTDKLTINAAATQLDAFLYAISDTQQSTFSNPTPLYHHHSVSLSAAVGHA